MFGIEKAYYEDRIDSLEKRIEYQEKKISDCIFYLESIDNKNWIDSLVKQIERLEKTRDELEIRLSALEEIISIDIKYNIDLNALKKYKYKKMTEIPIILNKKICEYQKKILNEIHNGDIFVGEIIEMIEEKENK